MATQNPEEVRETFALATELMQILALDLEERGEKREVVLVALQMLLSYVSVQMGTSFEDCMGSLAHNIPLFYRKWLEVESGDSLGRPVIDLETFRRQKEPK